MCIARSHIYHCRIMWTCNECMRCSVDNKWRCFVSLDDNRARPMSPRPGRGMFLGGQTSFSWWTEGRLSKQTDVYERTEGFRWYSGRFQIVGFYNNPGARHCDEYLPLLLYHYFLYTIASYEIIDIFYTIVCVYFWMTWNRRSWAWSISAQYSFLYALNQFVLEGRRKSEYTIPRYHIVL